MRGLCRADLIRAAVGPEIEQGDHSIAARVRKICPPLNYLGRVRYGLATIWRLYTAWRRERPLQTPLSTLCRLPRLPDLE